VISPQPAKVAVEEGVLVIPAIDSQTWTKEAHTSRAQQLSTQKGKTNDPTFRAPSRFF